MRKSASSRRVLTSAHKRLLVNIYLSDGREFGAILLKKGFAREWQPRHKVNWCD
ncbi:hypothetical protein [Rhizobium sp. Root1212]|uniref:hypothetical protein n=1 Tax=unclassified Rhizobium TaxID=2613769 RepID=UPI003298C7AF